LEQQFPETTETQPELLAYHYMAAGLSEHAIGYWQRAGRKAYERSANVEAISHLTQGLELLKTLPETYERGQQELTLYIALGMPLIATKGYAAPEVEHVYSRARTLCQQVGEPAQLFPVLHGLWLFYFVRGELQIGQELGEQLLTLAQRVQDRTFLLEAHRALGTTLLFLGELVPARAHLEEGLILYDLEQHRSLTLRYGQDSKVTCLGYAAWALWLLGYPDQAQARMHEMLTLAQELSHPFTLVFALNWAACVHRFRREWPLLHKCADEVIALSREHGFAQRVATGTILRGGALAEQGQRQEGIEQICQGLTAFRATGSEVGLPQYASLLIEAYRAVGQVEEACRVLAEALMLVDKHREYFWEAELHRLKGHLLLQQAVSDATQAEICFLQALAIAHRQQAKALELRAATSLTRLWQQQGKRTDAHQLLAEVYGWFTEGFDTADLQEARALLDTLEKE
jgi:predicted ATPase